MLDELNQFELDQQEQQQQIDAPPPPPGNPGPGDGEDPVAKKASDYMRTGAFFEKQLQSTLPFKRENLFKTYQTIPGENTSRYLKADQGFSPLIDNEDYYAQQQSGLEKIGKGLLQLPLSTLTKLGSGIGFTLGLVNPVNWFAEEGYISAAADNGISNFFDSWEKTSKNEWLPIYQEAADREKGFFSRAFTDINFWTDDFVDGAAFLASAWVPGLALSKAGLGLKTVNLMSKAGVATELGEGVVGLGRITQGADAFGEATKVFQGMKISAKGLDKFNAWALATSGEAMFEAKGVRDSVLKSLENSDYTEEQKKAIAGGAAKNAFLMNAALLAGTNSIELKWLGKLFGEGQESAVKGLIGAETFGSNLAKDQGANAITRFLNSGKGAFVKGVGTGILFEGYVEENAQLAIQRVNEAYGAQGKIMGIRDLDQVFKQYANQTLAAFRGEDTEAATSIGLGGILGGGMSGVSSVSQKRADDAFTSKMIDAFNQSQDNWLKFGNIYKTQTVISKDENGNEVKTEQVVLDQNKKPVIDNTKLTGVVAGYQAVNLALEESGKLQPGFQRDVLRDTAFAQFVTAHINAGIEGTIEEKLDKVLSSKPEDIAKLGFVLGDNTQAEINRYKTLAAAIIKQNKLINSDLAFDGSKEDKARKSYLTNLAAEQAVYRGLVSQAQSGLTEVRNEVVNANNTSLSDGLVDQLNMLNQRIKSQQQVIDSYGAEKANTVEATVAKEVLAELQETVAEVEKNNQETLKTLKKDQSGYYRYEKAERNDPALNKQLNKKMKLQGELENHVRSLVNQWTKFSGDNAKENFTGFFKEMVAPLLESLKNQQMNQESAPGKTATLTVTDENGNTKSIDITEGKVYVGKLTKSKKFRGNQAVTVFNNDKIKILAISEDGQTITIAANGEVLDMTADELADIAITEKWRSFESLTPDQKLYLSLRNSEIEYRVIDRDSSGKPVKNTNGKYKTRVVKGRVTLNKAKTDLLFSYIDPTSGKRRYVDFDMRYVENKKSLMNLLSPEEAAVKQQEAKVKQKYDAQQKYLTNLITETEAKLADADQRRASNDAEFAKLEKELRDLREMLDEAAAYIEKNPYIRGRKSNTYKAMEEMVDMLTAEIATKEQRLTMLTNEQQDLQKLLEALNVANEQYYQGLIELEEAGTPFLADESGTIYGQEAQQLETAEQNQITTRFSEQELDGMIKDTEAELELVDERVKFLQDHINGLRKLLNKILVYKDVADALMDITDRQQLRNALKLLEDQSTVIPENTEVIDVNGLLVPAGALERGTIQGIDAVKAELVKALRKGLASGKGIEAQYVLELVDRYKEAVSEMDELIERRDNLAPKLIRLETALEQNRLRTSLQERVEFLKTLQEGFLAQYEIENAENIRQRQAKTAEVVQNQMMGDKLADEEVSQDSETYNYDVKKPVLATHGLFTTAGRHFVDDADTQLNMENNNAMFYKFSASADLLTDEYFLVPVTADNDTFGIRREDVYADDIKLIVVKKVGNEYKYVDVNGQVLDNPTKETIVYTSMHGNATMFGTDLNAAVESVKKSFTTKGLTDAEIVEHIKKAQAFRTKLKADTKAGVTRYIPVTGKGKGVQTFVEKDASGLPQELPMEGRLIEEETMDYNNMVHPDGQPISLVVSTLNDNTAVDVKPGRVIMQKADGTSFRVFNRQLSQEEKDNFINVLKVLTGLMARKNSATAPLSKQEALDLNDILTYLNGIVFWTKPENSSQSANKFYINQDNGMLYRGTTAVSFTADALEAAKEELTKDLYHQVNNKLVKLNAPFYQVIVDNNNKISKVEYQNYVHYLLGTQDMKGQDRKMGTPVVYTNTPAYSADDLTPQVKSVYLTFQDPDNPIVPKVIVPAANASFPAAAAQPNTQPVVATAATGFVLNLGTPITAQPVAAQPQAPVSNPQQNPFVINLGAPLQAAPAAQPVQQAQPAGAMPSQFIINLNQPAAPQTTAAAPPANPFILPGQVATPGQPIVPTSLTAAPVALPADNEVITTLNKYAEPSDAAVEYQGDELYEPDQERGEPTTTLGKILKGLSSLPPVAYNFKSQTVPEYKQKVKAFLAANGLEENYEGILANIDRLVQEKTKTAIPNQTLISTILSAQYQQSMPVANDPNPKVNNVYREALDTLKKTEDFKKVAAWFEKNLPQIPVEKVAQLIDGLAWGAFKNGGVYLYENAEEGTGFHEAFEAVWASYLTVEEQMELAKAFRSLKGEFTNPFTKETKPYSQASMYDVREMLAEGMRDYMMDRQTYGGKILAFFKELWNAIKALVGMNNEAEDLINNVYKSINKGKYANAKAVRDVTAMGTAYAQAIPGTTQEFSTQFTEGLTGFFFMNLYASQNNIDSLIDKYANTHELLKQLYVQSLEDMKTYLVGEQSVFGQKYVAPAKAQLGRNLTADELNFLYTQYLNSDRNAYQIEAAFAYPKEVYNNLKSSLKKFGLQFKEITSEEDEQFVNNKEESTTDALGIRDAIYIDPRRLTAVNFRMLIGSLTNDTYDQAYKSDTNPMGIVFEKNNLGLPKMVDFDNVHNMLINELNGSASRIEGGKFIDALTEMINKLDKKYKRADGTYKPGYVWIQRLKNRLKYSGTEGGYFTNANITADDITMMIGFEKSLMNKQNLPVKTIIGENGYIFDTDPIQTNSQTKIREQWENNVMTTVVPLSRKSPATLLGVNDKGMIVIDRNSHFYAGNPADTTKPFLAMGKPTFNQIIDILGELGIKFSVPNEELKKYKVVINRSYGAIREKIMDGTINTMQDLYGPNFVNKAISDLVDIEVEYNAEDNVLMHFTADGKPQYSITLPSNITYVLNSLNDAKTLADFVSSNPQFGYVDASGAVVLHPYQSRSLLLKAGGLIFDANGNKRSDMDLNYHLISGVANQNSDGRNTADLTYPDRVMQEIHYLLKNIHYTIINSDKSTEFGIGVNQSFVSFRNASADINSEDFRPVLDIYMDQLEDEIDAAIREQELPSNIQYYSKEVKKLGHYREILGEALVKEFTEKVLTGKMTKEKFLNKPAVMEAIKKHINNLANETLEGLVELDIINRVQIGTANNRPVYEYSTKAISQELLSDLKLDGSQMNQAQMDSLMTYLAVNKEVAVTEQHKLIYGHPVIYKDLAKRANGVNSTKDAIVDNHEVIKWMDKNMPRLDGKNRSENVIQTFKNISFQDVHSVSNYYKEIAEGMYKSMKDDLSKKDAEKRIGAQFDSKGNFKNFILDEKKGFTGELKAYLDLTEQDGQGYIMPDFYRDMLYLSAKFSKDQLRQWEYEMAYEVITRSQKRKNHPAYKDYSKIYTKEQMAQFRRILEAGSPGAIMQPLKPQYFGYANNQSLMQTVFLKHSVQPKFYRQVEGTQFENMYVAAQNSQVDLINYESGQKVGNMLNAKGEFLPIYDSVGEMNVSVEYNDNGSTKNVSLPEGLPVQELFTRYYGIQQEVPGIAKTKVVRGTQVTKLVMTNFKVDGKYTSDKAGQLIEEYNDLLKDMIRTGKEELISELGIQVLSDGSYVVADINKMIKLLRNELEKRDLPNNLLEGLQPAPDGVTLMYKFDTLANRNKIDNILNSVVDSRVISDKMFGKAAVQVAGTGFESSNRTMVYLNEKGAYEEVGDKVLTDEQKKTMQATSNELKFYRNENGSIQAMEVYLPWFFEGVSPEDMGLKLMNGVYQVPANMDKRLLEAIGFRIPTQGMNSIENMVIKGFLPKEMGDMVVVPSEIVGKAGSDFDIDKLNIYLSNYELKYSKFSPAAIKDFKESIFYTNLSTPVRTALAKFTEEQFATLVEEMKDYSISSGMGKYGNLDAYLKKNNITGFEQEFYTDVKQALVDYNQYRYDLRQQNKDAKRDFDPVVEEIVYVEGGRDSKGAMQNRFKEIMQELVSLPENYRQLTVPNGAATLKGLAGEINELKRKQDSEKSFLALRKFIPMNEIRQRYITGKTMVGTAALHTTSHTMSQVAGIRLTGTYDPKRLQYLFPNNRKKEIVIRLKHNRNENGDLYLYARQDQSGAWISELISEALTGFVDAAKDPFVFELNLNLATADTWFYLQKLGVPVQDIAYMFNQPIVDQYFKEQAKNQSFFKKANGENMSNFLLMLKVAAPYMDQIPALKGTYENVTNLLSLIEKTENSDRDFRSKTQEIIGYRKAIKSIREKTAQVLDGFRNESSTLSTEELKNAIGNYYSEGYKMTEADAKFQLGVLLDYLEYNQQARFLKEFIKSIGYDNTKTKSIIENQLQNSRWNKMLESEFIANPDAILENTFLGEMKEQKEDLPKLFQQFFVSLHPKAQPAFEPLKRQINNPEIFMSNEDQAELINKYQNFFISYIIQTTPYMKNGVQTALNTQYENLMKGAMSMGKQLKMLREVPDPNIAENLVVKELLPILTSDSTQVDNIKLFKNRMDTYKNNVLIESIENLQTYAKSTGNVALQNFIENLGIFAILQTGLQEGGLNYTKILPVHLYTKVVNEIMTNFTDGVTQINPQLIWRQFHQNNWRNTAITPKVQFAKKDRLTGNLKLKASYSDSEYDYVVKTTIRPDISGRANEQRRAELMKQKRYNEVFETVLYEKVESGVDMGDDVEVIFRPIQKLGDGYKFVEVYAEDRPSIIPQNLTVDPTTGALQATYIPQSDVAVATQGSAVKPVQAPTASMPSNLILNLGTPAAAPVAGDINAKKQQVEAIVTAPGYVKDSAKKHLAKELFKIRQATQFIGTGGGNDSTTQRMENAYNQVGLANTGKYSSSDLIYVSSNGNRSNRYNPVERVVTPYGSELGLKGVYINIDTAVNAKARFIMDTKANLDATSSYNLGEVALADYLTSKGYTREDATGIWSPAGQQVPASQTDAEIRNSAAYKTWAAANANPLMTDQENLEYYKQCKL